MSSQTEDYISSHRNDLKKEYFVQGAPCENIKPKTTSVKKHHCLEKTNLDQEYCQKKNNLVKMLFCTVGVLLFGSVQGIVVQGDLSDEPNKEANQPVDSPKKDARGILQFLESAQNMLSQKGVDGSSFLQGLCNSGNHNPPLNEQAQLLTEEQRLRVEVYKKLHQTGIDPADLSVDKIEAAIEDADSKAHFMNYYWENKDKFAEEYEKYSVISQIQIYNPECDVPELLTLNIESLEKRRRREELISYIVAMTTNDDCTVGYKTAEYKVDEHCYKKTQTAKATQRQTCAHMKTEALEAKLKDMNLEYTVKGSKYRIKTLDNGMTCILVQRDHTYKTNSVCLSIDVGAMEGSKEFETDGLAHLLEHLLGGIRTGDAGSLSVEKTIQKKLAGTYNAWTDWRRTGYHAESTPDKFEELVKLHASMFVKTPAWDKDTIQNEAQAIKEEFALRKNHFSRYFGHLQRHLLPIDHPGHFFGTGNEKTLKPEQWEMLQKKAQALYRSYSANLMTLVIVSNKPLKDTEKLVELHYSDIKNKHREVPKYVLPVSDDDVDAKHPRDASTVTWLKPSGAAAHKNSVVFEWYFKDLEQTLPLMDMKYVIAHRGKGSLHDELMKRGFFGTFDDGVGVTHANSHTPTGYSCLTLTLTSSLPTIVAEYKKVAGIVLGALVNLSNKWHTLHEKNDERLELLKKVAKAQAVCWIAPSSMKAYDVCDTYIRRLNDPRAASMGPNHYPFGRRCENKSREYYDNEIFKTEILDKLTADNLRLYVIPASDKWKDLIPETAEEKKLPFYENIYLEPKPLPVLNVGSIELELPAVLPPNEAPDKVCATEINYSPNVILLGDGQNLANKQFATDISLRIIAGKETSAIHRNLLDLILTDWKTEMGRLFQAGHSGRNFKASAFSGGFIITITSKNAIGIKELFQFLQLCGTTLAEHKLDRRAVQMALATKSAHGTSKKQEAPLSHAGNLIDRMFHNKITLNADLNAQFKNLPDPELELAHLNITEWHESLVKHHKLAMTGICKGANEKDVKKRLNMLSESMGCQLSQQELQVPTFTLPRDGEKIVISETNLTNGDNTNVVQMMVCLHNEDDFPNQGRDPKQSVYVDILSHFANTEMMVSMRQGPSTPIQKEKVNNPLGYLVMARVMSASFINVPGLTCVVQSKTYDVDILLEQMDGFINEVLPTKIERISESQWMEVLESIKVKIGATTAAVMKANAEQQLRFGETRTFRSEKITAINLLGSSDLKDFKTFARKGLQNGGRIASQVFQRAKPPTQDNDFGYTRLQVTEEFFKTVDAWRLSEKTMTWPQMKDEEFRSTVRNICEDTYKNMREYYKTMDGQLEFIKSQYPVSKLHKYNSFDKIIKEEIIISTLKKKEVLGSKTTGNVKMIPAKDLAEEVMTDCSGYNREMVVRLIHMLRKNELFEQVYNLVEWDKGSHDALWADANDIPYSEVEGYFQKLLELQAFESFEQFKTEYKNYSEQKFEILNLSPAEENKLFKDPFIVPDIFALHREDTRNELIDEFRSLYKSHHDHDCPSRCFPGEGAEEYFIRLEATYPEIVDLRQRIDCVKKYLEGGFGRKDDQRNILGVNAEFMTLSNFDNEFMTHINESIRKLGYGEKAWTFNEKWKCLQRELPEELQSMIDRIIPHIMTVIQEENLEENQESIGMLITQFEVAQVIVEQAFARLKSQIEENKQWDQEAIL